MNCLYEKLWLYYNLFQPVLRLSHKEIVPQGRGTYRVRYKYGPARTPFDRLCATGAISEERKEALVKLQQGINPRRLRREIRELADAILRMPSAAKSSETQDVYLTLYRLPVTESASPVTLSFDRMEPAR